MSELKKMVAVVLGVCLVHQLVLLLCGGRAAESAVAQTARAASLSEMRFHCERDTARVNELLARGEASGLKSAGELVVFYGRELMGTPYVGHTLESEREWLTINVDELDCTTLVETLYALARTTLDGRRSWRDYADNLESVRYRGGELGDYSSRLHYISEWIIDNRMRGNLMEVTSDIPHATSMVKTINYMSQHRGSYAQLKDNDSLFAKIREFEIGYRNHRIPYVKRTWLNAGEVKKALQSGDFVGLVTSVEGLDVSHMGVIYVDEKGEPRLLHASMSGGEVRLEEKSLYKFLQGSKTVVGVRVFRMMKR